MPQSSASVAAVSPLARAPRPAAGPTDPGGSQPESASPERKKPAILIFGLLMGFATLALLALVIGVVWLFPADAETVDQSQPPVVDVAIDDENQAAEVMAYREVKLPEADRRRIYAQMKSARGMTTESKVPLPRDSQVGQFFQRNMQKVLDREAEMQGIMNKVEPEDVQEIVKEGDAKGW